MRTEPVVVGVDGSESARRAASWAAAEAVSRQRPLILVHVVRWPVYEESYLVPPGSVFGVEPMREWAKAMLARVADELRAESPGLELHERIESGDPPDVLFRVGSGAALVVIGSTGLGRLSRLLVGSTAGALVGHCLRPVVVVRGTEMADRRVVVGVDGSGTSVRAVEFAYEFASRRGAEVVAVHAWSDVPLDLVGSVQAVNLEAVMGDARTMLAEKIARCAGRHPEVTARTVVAAERPVDVLLELAEGAGLLVVGSRGRGALRRALLGSVSNAVVQEAPCPVAVLREPVKANE